MKKIFLGVLFLFLFLFVKYRYLGSIDENEKFSMSVATTALILNKYSDDSLNIKTIVGDTFCVLNDGANHIIRNGICLLELSDVRNPRHPVYDRYNYVAVIDIHNKKLKNIIYVKNGFQTALFDYYRDTLYMADNSDCYYVRYIDTKSNKSDTCHIDPCNTAPGAGAIIRTGNNLFITGKPYEAGIVNWKTKFCNEYNNIPNLSSSCGFVHPINNEINLIDYLEDTLSHRYFYAYDKLGKKKWTYLASQYAQFIGHKDFFIGLSYDYLVVLNKKNGKLIHAVQLSKNEWSILDVNIDTIMLRYEIKNGDAQKHNENFNTVIEAIDIRKGKKLWSKKIKGRFIKQQLDNIFVTVYDTNNKIAKYLVYSRNNFQLIAEFDYKFEDVKYKDRFWTSDAIWVDRETNKHYTFRGKYIYW